MFLCAATAKRATAAARLADRFDNPVKGPKGEPLSTDIARVGPTTRPRSW